MLYASVPRQMWAWLIGRRYSTVVPRVGSHRSGDRMSSPACRRDAAEILAGEADEDVMVHVACGGDHDAAGLVMIVPRATGDPPDGTADILFGADDRIAERMVGKDGPLEVVVNDVFRIVLGVLQLLDDDQLLPLHLLLFEGCVQDEVRKHIHRLADVRIEHAGVEAGLFLRREGVQVAAEGLEALCDLPDIAVLRPLEHHVLKEMADPVLGGSFVTGSDIRPDPDGNGTDVRDRLADYPYTVVQRGLAIMCSFRPAGES